MGEAKRKKQAGIPPSSSRKPAGGKLLWIGAGVITLAVVAALVVMLTRPPAPTSAELPVAAPDAAPFPADQDRFGISVGPEDATVVVREFADYQCPGCAQFSGVSQRLKEEYVESGKVRFVYFDLPLRQHANAIPAAMAARCAGDQNEYWAMHDEIYRQQSSWSGASDPAAVFAGYAGRLGLNGRRFQSCMESELHREAVEESLQLAVRLGVVSTPTVLVNNIPLTQPGWAQLSAVVERELAR